MGLPVTRLGDTCTGHVPFPPRNSLTGSGDVSVNGKPAHAVGDTWAVHCSGPTCHPGTLTAGSSSVFVNGKPLGRVGDTIDCGSTVATGSPDVFAGG